jgi:hypothetical protein
MRARGAKVTDIVVVVVAADDGVMPQTIEAIDHARAANVPIIVAVNKIDKPEAQPDRVKQQLADRGLQPEAWGGSTVFVDVSAKMRKNLDLLEEMICLVADLAAPKAQPERPAVGTVIEAKLDRGRGAVASILVQNGTLRTGDSYIVGNTFGKIRAMFDDRGRAIEEAGPSTPVEILGLEGMPDAGDTFLGSLFFTQHQGLAEAAVQRAWGVGAMALGNHEFDRGVEELRRLQQGGCAKNTTREPCAVEASFPGARYRYLAANVTDGQGQTLFPATGIKRFGSGVSEVTVGIIGLPLKDVPSLVSPAGVAGWTFGDEVAAINRATAQLKSQGADAVVVLIHQGLLTSETSGIAGCDQPRDALGPILSAIDPRVDVVVSGHTHWAYVCEWASRDAGDTILATSAGRDGTMVTDITLSIDPVTNRVVAKSARQVIVQSQPFRDVVNTDAVARFTPRPEVAAYVRQYSDAGA